MSRQKFFTAAWSSLLFSFIFTSSTIGNDINTGGQLGVVRTLSTQSLHQSGFNLGGALKYGTERDYVSGPNGIDPVISTKTSRGVTRNNPHLFSGNLYGAYGLTNNWDISLDLPLYYDITGWDETRSGVGDLELATKVVYPYGRYAAWLTHGYYLKIILPTGNTDHGYFARHAYFLTQSVLTSNDAVFSTKTVYFNPEMIWSVDFSKFNAQLPLRFHGNFGGVIATKKSSSAVVAALALEWQPLSFLTLFTEVSGESRIKWYSQSFSFRDFINDPFFVTPGFKFALPHGLYITAAGDIGVTESAKAFRNNFSRNGYAYATKAVPRYNAQITFGWQGHIVQPDRDKDGIIDKLDKCIDVAEDIDGFEDEDGCPDFDNDNDGIIDSRDSCPNQAATCSGCPILDADGDGIHDDRDRCPTEPEDFDGFQDDDGCPDRDNDNDGIADADDKCPLIAEDMDGFEDNDGCPDLDNDGDGVLDALDKCPNVVGVAENSGCPKTEEIKRGKLVLSGVAFESGKAILTPNSYTILDQVYESLAEWTNVKLEIQGHTDNQGSDQVNLRLSQERAETVMNYLIRKGISSSRLNAIGLGESAPIADNRTAAGRALNRRVELKRVD